MREREADLQALQNYIGVIKPPKGVKVDKPRKEWLLLHLQGYRVPEIAASTNSSPSAVYKFLKTDTALQLKNDYLNFTEEEFRSLYVLTVHAIRDALVDDDIDIRLKAADKVLKARGDYDKHSQRDERDTAEDVIRRIVEMDKDGKVSRMIEERPKSMG